MVKVVKICGLKSIDGCSSALSSGADLLGMIMVPGRVRSVDMEIARQMVQMVREKRVQNNRRFTSSKDLLLYAQESHSGDFNDFSSNLCQLLIENGPFIVGVFRNQPLPQVFDIARDLELDFIQLHGSEDKLLFFEANKELQFGIIPRYVLPKDTEEMQQHLQQYRLLNGVALPLLDSDAGGEGKVIDWSLVEQLTFGNFILAGGLNPSNLHETKHLENVVAFDVSGGVEDENGDKDPTKIHQFVTVAKSL